jgi:hypothetical protein
MEASLGTPDFHRASFPFINYGDFTFLAHMAVRGRCFRVTGQQNKKYDRAQGGTEITHE